MLSWTICKSFASWRLLVVFSSESVDIANDQFNWRRHCIIALGRFQASQQRSRNTPARAGHGRAARLSAVAIASESSGEMVRWSLLKVSQMQHRASIRMSAKSQAVIPDIVIGRLPLYLRALRRLQQEEKSVTSAHELGRRLDISSAQIRKDLSHFGGFGKQGTGYQIEYLIDKLQEVLQINQEWMVAVVGAGNLGIAISHYRGFQDRGFRIAHLFDVNPQKIGQRIGEFVVQPVASLRESIRHEGIKIAMLAVPAEEAQTVADQLVDAGVQAILNYAPININVPAEVQIQYIDPVTHLQHMTFYLEE